MPTISDEKRINDLVEKSSVSLAHGAYFECERMALKALSMQRQRHDFEGMIRVVEILMQSRLQRLQAALDCGKVTIFSDPITESMSVSTGCYLIQPPQVGADARRLRLAAFQCGVSVAVLCREPVTRLKLCPIVAICPGTTIRTRIDPPKNLEQPDIKWFAGALEALGEAAIESIDPGTEVVRRVDAIIERLDALPEHVGLHETLAAYCREAMNGHDAAKAKSESGQPPSDRGRRKRKQPS